MMTVHVRIHVKPECLADFKKATAANVKESIKEAGIARFDLLQRMDDQERFVLVEVYRTADAQGRHKETAHYKTWFEAVAPMMAEPRASEKFEEV
ncbi:MAG TPA: putative quinol monooxygenase [Verrucomicrobiae bacterium]|jgi:quinol monooxygenase YgiN